VTSAYTSDELGRRKWQINTGTAFVQDAYNVWGYNPRSELTSSKRYAGSTVEDPPDPANDADGDGVCGDVDACADSDVSDMIVIDGCDTGVANQALGDGCTMADEIAKAAAGARNHGQFVSAAAHLTKDWMKAGRITGADKGRIQRCAGRADFDADGDVDMADFQHFQVCFNGPNRPTANVDCEPADFDADADVDMSDFRVFQGCFNGPNRPPACE
jgi:hypothetical protein